MPTASRPVLIPGRVYRTEDFSQHTAEPAALVRRLVRSGELVRVHRGLYAQLKQSKWGPVPPDSREIVRAFLRTDAFLFTGSNPWNALGLGSTAVFAVQLVYNARRAGRVALDGRRFDFRRVRFPVPQTAEWFAVDLIQNRRSAGVSADQLVPALARAIVARQFPGGPTLDLARLEEAAATYGTRETQALVRESIRLATADPASRTPA
jgi:hypothetical protein